MGREYYNIQTHKNKLNKIKNMMRVFIYIILYYNMRKTIVITFISSSSSTSNNMSKTVFDNTEICLFIFLLAWLQSKYDNKKMFWDNGSSNSWGNNINGCNSHMKQKKIRRKLLYGVREN